MADDLVGDQTGYEGRSSEKLRGYSDGSWQWDLGCHRL